MDFSQEYFELIRIYEDYNKQALELKTWSVTVGITAILGTISAPISTQQKRIAALVTSLFAIPFWFTETLWKLFQAAYVDRLTAIEACAQSNNFSCGSPYIMHAWQDSYADGTIANWASIAFKPHLLLPHIMLLIAGLALFIYYGNALKKQTAARTIAVESGM